MSAVLALDPDADQGASESGQLLVAFEAGGETFGAPIGAIREIRAWSGARPCPILRPLCAV